MMQFDCEWFVMVRNINLRVMDVYENPTLLQYKNSFNKLWVRPTGDTVIVTLNNGITVYFLVLPLLEDS